jgi:lysophospholipase L1-like esterase
MKIFLLMLLLLTGTLRAQLDSLKLSCLNDSMNVIQNKAGLNPFLEALDQLQHGQRKVVSIIHLGDSHVQAGFFSAPLRTTLQTRYGNAGRGVVFPYQAAGTNGPPDYSFNSQQVWISKRNCVNKNNLPTGIAGHTIYSSQRSAKLSFKPRERSITGQPEQIVIFHGSRADSNFTYQLSDSLGKPVAVFDSVASSPTRSVFTLTRPAYSWRIVNDSINKNGRSSTLFGASMENAQPGIRLHTIGVNGAEYQHYLRSVLFQQQLGDLRAQLIIISLGTNEAYNTGDFNPEVFESRVDSFLTSIQKTLPDASILLTSPPGIGQQIRVGSKKKRRAYQYIENKNIPIVCEILKRQAELHSAAYWDFYAVMGGCNAMSCWAAQGLTDKRRIHFSRKGYSIQGTLLMKALDQEINPVSH